jgi:hypothetical protein
MAVIVDTLIDRAGTRSNWRVISRASPAQVSPRAWRCASSAA